MKKIEKIKQKRQNTYIMQRLRKGRQLENERDIKEVHRDLALIRSPAAGLKNRKAAEEIEEQEFEEKMEGIAEENCEEV